MRISRDSSYVKRKQADNKIKSRSTSTRSLSNSQVESKYYFCHYKNAMYMGGMKSFQKHGLGILLHDDGYSVICNYHNDLKHGHQIVYAEHCLMSLLYNKNKIVQSVFRFQNYLLYIKFNKDCQPDGKAILVDYENRQISYITYRKATIVEKKQEKQNSILNRVFDLQNLQFLIGITHSKALRYQIDDNQNIYCQKMENKFNIGFYKRGLINGLGFTYTFKEPYTNIDTHRNVSHVYLKPIQRGYFHNSQLFGLGEKWFKNGNYYFGDFKNNIFEGRGILKNSAKNNWVYGTFQRGNLSQLIQYSHEGDLSRFKKLAEWMHQRKSTWIQKQILIQSPDNFKQEIQKIVNNKSSLHVKSLQQRKQQVLKKIQQNFICENPQNILSSSRNIKNYKQINYSNYSKKKNLQQINENSFSSRYKQSINQSSYQSPGQKKIQSDKMSPINDIKNDYQKNNERTALKTDYKQQYKIKIIQVPTTADQLTQRGKSKQLSPGNYSSNQLSKMKISQRTLNFSQIKEEEPTYEMNEKKMIGRSRLFKYLPKSDNQDPPHFNYVPTK